MVKGHVVQNKPAGKESTARVEKVRPGRNIVLDAMDRGASSLDEAKAKELFASYGIPVTPGRIVETTGKALTVAKEIGFPVVMKGSATGLLHKSDAGLVILNVKDEADVRAGYAELKKRGEGKLEGVLVERMISGSREFVVGMSRDPQFGPVVMFGIGGILTEALQDVVFGVAPLQEIEAAEMLDSIRSSKLLKAFRGLPPVDRQLLIHTIQTVGQMALDHPEIREIDINPLLIDGSRPVAVDALVTLAPPPPKAEPRLPINLSALDTAFAPRSIAVVGASNDPNKWGGTLLISLINGKYEGKIYPINPKASSIFGVQAYPSISALPESPDLVLLAVPAHLVQATVEECGQKGVPTVVVVTAGFSELSKEGAAMEQEIAATASKYKMALIGPNCMGILSSKNKVYAMGGSVLRPGNGPVSFVSQSGNMGVQLMSVAETHKGGIGKFVSIGNEGLFNTADIIQYLRDDPDTGAIIAYIEGFDDGRQFLEVARDTVLKKPLVVLRSGLSEYGSRAALSHTGTMAGSSKVFDAVVRQCGIIAVTNPDEFLDITFGLSYLPPVKGCRVAVISLGGGWGVLSADEISRTGLTLADLPGDVIEKLNTVLPPFWSHSNPIDIVGARAPGVTETVLETVLQSDAVDAVISLGVIGSLSSRVRTFEEAELVRKRLGEASDVAAELENLQFIQRELKYIESSRTFMERYKKPVLNVSFVKTSRGIYTGDGRYATVIFPSPIRAVRALSRMVKYHRFLESRK